MNVFKRLYVTTFGSIDSFVTRIQNHDALVGASLKELEGRIREAQISFGSLTRTLQRSTDAIAQADRELVTWTERARKEGGAGRKEAALECLRRAESTKQTRAALTKQLAHSEVSHRALQSRIVELQNLQKTLTLRHRELKARTQMQEADSSTAAISEHDVAEMLNRWEDSLGAAPVGEPVEDTFERTFSREEEREALEAQLAELLK